MAARAKAARPLPELLAWWERELADRHVPEEQLAALRHVEARRFGARETVFDEGAPCAGLWIILQGTARLFHLTADGRERIVAFRGPVSVLEVVPALDGKRHATTAMTLEPAVLALIPVSVIQEVRRYPGPDQSFYNLLCQEIRQRDIDAAVASTRGAAERVACTLLRLALSFDAPAADGSIAIDCPLPRQALADLVGIRVETVSRVLSELARDGVVDASGRGIRIRDPRGLRRAAGCGECQLDCTVFAPLPEHKRQFAAG